ncbi:endolytic transglycosylase MltG [Streptomyces sp. NPDC000594]|uniref:endolytic transglycosylase MltG n=1 Tax=Streptomyces sp. NPDC000594 TaxID=3154261 RepID=UPI003324BFD9
MTEYGRGPGSAPWQPEDPLYGDPAWTGQQNPHADPLADPLGQSYQGHPGQSPEGNPQYGTPDPYQQHQQPQHQQHQAQHQQPYEQAPGQPYPDPSQQHAQPFTGQGVPGGQGGYEGQGAGYPGQGGYEGQPGPGQVPAAPGYGDQQYVPQQPQHPQQPYGEQQFPGGWDAGQQTAMPYDPTQGAAVPGDPYGGRTPDPYTGPDAYPPPEPPDRRTEHPPGDGAAEAPLTEDGTDGDDERHPAPDDDGAGPPPPPGRSRRGDGSGRGGGRSKKQRKSRNGVACLVVAAVLAGGVGTVGYFGYQFWEGRFGPAPDYSGSGSGTVQVEIPQGAVGSEIGRILKKNGVVKSVDAFVSAQGNNPKGQSVQAGVYTLKKEMSGASALEAMLRPESRNALIIPEGRRNAWVYQQIDKRLELEPGTTQKVAREEAGQLGLPKWATGHPKLKDPLEGFLFPASYPVAKGTEPEKVLKRMVARAVTEYGRIDLAKEARELGLKGPWQLITVASMVQAEGKTDDDFRKMSEVVYNRLKPGNTQSNGKIEFDSAYNYLKGKSEIKISLNEIRNDPDVYNTYYHEGLPPGPIGNPGMQALEAAIDPTDDGWYYFVATDGMNKTEFAKTLSEFNVLRDKFNESGVE